MEVVPLKGDIWILASSSLLASTPLLPLVELVSSAMLSLDGILFTTGPEQQGQAMIKSSHEPEIKPFIPINLLV